jgi:hypothetical protein
MRALPHPLPAPAATLVAALCTAPLLAGCGDASGPQQPFSASGSVTTWDGSPVPALAVTVSGGGSARTVPVGTDGTFSVEADVRADTVQLVVDHSGTGARTTLPALVRVSGRAPARDLRIVLVPAYWTIAAGTYAGTTVAVSMDAAFQAPCSTPGDKNCDGFYPADWLGGVKQWPARLLPVRVAFDRANSHQPISAADSAAFWATVGRMNQDAGTILFRPARMEEITLGAANRPVDAVVVRVDTTLTGFSAWTHWWWNAAGDMYAGVVRPASTAQLRVEWLMTHELLHTHGFKHSCAWATVMGSYGCNPAQRLTIGDVAYLQLAMRVHQRQQATGAAHGLAAALQGERVRMKGLPLFAPSPAALRLLLTDSIGHADHGDHASTGAAPGR